MTRNGVKEYIEAIWERYRRGKKGKKGRILNEAVDVTGYHRKAVIRLMGGKPRGSRSGPRGRPRRYGPRVVEGLKVAWEATDRLCSKRLQPFLPELVPVLRRHGERCFTAEVETQLRELSAATIDRLLKPFRRTGGRRPFSTTKPGTLLKKAIPVRTFADWNEERPGFFEVDLVSHCGESTEGFYLTTLSAVDVATGWVECQAVWGKSQERVGSAVHHLTQRLPFPLLGLDSDNGGEFINQHLLAYCQRNAITFTRSRPYKKNDSSYVEQKNWSVVRRLIGYDRYSSRVAFDTLHSLYQVVRLYMNFFQPVMQLQHKSRQGAKVHKRYDRARTPYRRLLETGVLTEPNAAALAATYEYLDPRTLLAQINGHLQHLWAQAQLPDGGPPSHPKRNTVTPLMTQ